MMMFESMLIHLWLRTDHYRMHLYFNTGYVFVSYTYQYSIFENTLLIFINEEFSL